MSTSAAASSVPKSTINESDGARTKGDQARLFVTFGRGNEGAAGRWTR
jgi:hypothetical protein